MDKNHNDIPTYDETNNYKISENSDQDSCKVSKRPGKKSHKESKRYQCPYCKSKFSQKHNLNSVSSISLSKKSIN